MNFFEGRPRPTVEANANKSECLMAGVTATPTTFREIPEAVRDHLERDSRKYIHPENYTPENFPKAQILNYENGDIGYLAEQDKTYDNTNETERLTFIVDTRDSVETGYIEIRFNLASKSKYFKNKPFVGVTRTYEDFENEGLGTRRLRVANAYVVAVYGLPLCSDSLMTEGARAVWDKLVASHEAEKFKEGTHDRYRFILKK